MMKVGFSAMRDSVDSNDAYAVLTEISAIRYLDQFYISNSWIEVDGTRFALDNLLLLLLDKRKLLLTQKCELNGKVKPLDIDLIFSTASGVRRKVIRFLTSKDWYAFSSLIVLLSLPLRTPASLDAEQKELVKDLLAS